MAATAITVQKAVLSVAATSTSANVDGNFIDVGTNDRVVLRFANTDGSSKTVTFDDPNSATPESATAFNPDVSVVVPATTGVMVVLLDGARLRRFRDPATGRINWTYSAVTTVKVEAFAV